MCTCWRLTCLDGTTIGLTDHDQDIVFGGSVFSANAGADGSTLESTTSLAPDNSELLGVMLDGAITAKDLSTGRYDEAKLEVFRVDWEDPSHRILVRSGVIGDVIASGEGYSAEFRSAKSQLDQPAGRVYGRSCDATLGGARCQADLDLPTLRIGGVVLSTSPRSVTVSLERSVDPGWFDHGKILWTDDTGRPRGASIYRHHPVDGGDEIALWEAIPDSIPEAASVTLVAGCDRRIETCREKFQNHLNFQGFPSIPGADSLIAYPQTAKG